MKTILITGTTSGIGQATAVELARTGHRIIMANRNREKANNVRQQIVQQTGNNEIQLLDLDLASQASVRACAAAFLEQHSRLDILINNAGMMTPEQTITDDGFELQFAANALSQLLLTLELKTALLEAAPSQVIFVTSLMHKFGKLDPASFRGWPTYSGGGAYGQSKLVMTMLATELAEQLRDRRVTVNCLHPGAVNTGILNSYPRFAQFFLRLLFATPEKGARTTLHLATQDPGKLPTGKYFVNARESKTHKLVTDATARAELLDECCNLLNIPAPI
ncbi:MAG: SDR family NAD(P)-dependent oxidoreductase [Pseudomonadota bacterium]